MARDRYRTGGSYIRRWEFSRKLDLSLQYIVEYVYMIFQYNFNINKYNICSSTSKLKNSSDNQGRLVAVDLYKVE